MSPHVDQATRINANRTEISRFAKEPIHVEADEWQGVHDLRRRQRHRTTDIDAKGDEETLATIRDAGGEAIFVTADITVEEEIAAVVARAVATYGRLDTAINNAGMSPNSQVLHLIPTDAWRKILDVHLTSVFLCMKHQIAAMLDNGAGAIVNVSSVAGLVGISLCGDYSATKHGIIGLTKTASLDYATKGIRINAIAPGGVKTPMLTRAWEADPSLREHTEKSHPMRRAGEPREIANAAIWLLSDRAGFVTGTCLPVDGGSTAR